MPLKGVHSYNLSPIRALHCPLHKLSIRVQVPSQGMERNPKADEKRSLPVTGCLVPRLFPGKPPVLSQALPAGQSAGWAAQ